MMTAQKPAVTHGTFVIERNYPTTPERVFAALADPKKKRRWYAAGASSEVEEFEMDFRVGGNERTQRRFKEGSPFPGTLLINHTNYQDIVPNRRVVLAYTMTLGERRISASLATFELVPTEKGTDLIFTEQGAYFEGADGPKMREDGWRKLLESLAKELANSWRERTKQVRTTAAQRVNIDRVFHALGDATRRAIVEKLSERPLTVSSLALPLNITLAAVVQHLQILEQSGLVHTEKVGRVRTCSLGSAGLSVAEGWINECRAIWEKRFDRLGELLAELDEE